MFTIFIHKGSKQVRELPRQTAGSLRVFCNSFPSSAFSQNLPSRNYRFSEDLRSAKNYKCECGVHGFCEHIQVLFDVNCVNDYKL